MNHPLDTLLQSRHFEDPSADLAQRIINQSQGVSQATKTKKTFRPYFIGTAIAAVLLTAISVNILTPQSAGIDTTINNISESELLAEALLQTDYEYFISLNEY